MLGIIFLLKDTTPLGNLLITHWAEICISQGCPEQSKNTTSNFFVNFHFFCLHSQIMSQKIFFEKSSHGSFLYPCIAQHQYSIYSWDNQNTASEYALFWLTNILMNRAVVRQSSLSLVRSCVMIVLSNVICFYSGSPCCIKRH